MRVYIEAVDGFFKSYHIWVMRLPFYLVIDNTRYAQAMSSMFDLGGRAGYGIITIFGPYDTLSLLVVHPRLKNCPSSLYYTRVHRVPEAGREAIILTVFGWGWVVVWEKVLEFLLLSSPKLKKNKNRRLA